MLQHAPLTGTQHFRKQGAEKVKVTSFFLIDKWILTFTRSAVLYDKIWNLQGLLKYVQKPLHDMVPLKTEKATPKLSLLCSATNALDRVAGFMALKLIL